MVSGILPIISNTDLSHYPRGNFQGFMVVSRFLTIQFVILNFDLKNPIVMFAGEHTHKEYFSTAHGAFLSGIRESERLLNKLNNT